jgi:CheY-like chemotaxis protein
MSDASAMRPVVLVVEDDYLIRKGAVAIIQEAGFQVVEADNADDALEILEADSNVHIVFYGYPDAGFNRRAQAGEVCQGSLAADKNRSDIRQAQGRQR